MVTNFVLSVRDFIAMAFNFTLILTPVWWSISRVGLSHRSISCRREPSGNCLAGLLRRRNSASFDSIHLSFEDVEL